MSHTTRFMHRLLHYWPAKVISLAVALLMVLFNDFSSLEVRVISVPLEIIFPEQFLPATEYPSNVRVSLRGEGEEIVGILSEDLRAYIDLSNRESGGLRNSSVIIERRGNALEVDPLEISVDPSQISLRMENRELRDINIEPIVSGAPPPGYQLLQVRVSPSIIEVAGPQSLIEQLELLPTESIELTDRRESFTTRVELVSPRPLLQYPGGNAVDVAIEIGETQIVNTYNGVEVELIDLLPSLSIVPPLPTVDIQLEGRYSLLQELDFSLVTLIADASALQEAGQYELEVQFELSEELTDINLIEILPSSISVTVE